MAAASSPSPSAIAAFIPPEGTTPAVNGTTTPAPVMPKPKKSVPTTPNKVIGAKVTLQYMGEDGKVYEATTTIDPDEYKIQSYALSVDEKHRMRKDKDGDIEGFEDVGERILTFKLKFHTRY